MRAEAENIWYIRVGIFYFSDRFLTLEVLIMMQTVKSKRRWPWLLPVVMVLLLLRMEDSYDFCDMSVCFFFLILMARGMINRDFLFLIAYPFC